MNPDEDFSEICDYLIRHLGLKLAAYVCGLKNTRLILGWKHGKCPQIEAEVRVRYAHQAILFIIEAFGADTAKAWLMGMNQHLGDRAPAWVLRHGKRIEDLKLVVSAAKQFVAI